MALCLADSLLECDGFDARDQVERYRRWQKDGYLSATGQCLGITASTARALAMAQWRRQLYSGSHDPTQLDPEPLSRVGVAVMFYLANAEEALRQATESARTTCQSPAVLEACRTFADLMLAALSGQPKAAILAQAPAARVRRPRSESPTLGPGGAGGSASGRSARRQLCATPLLRAVNLGGHSDVVGACAASSPARTTRWPPSRRAGATA